jgi:membrane-associated phospholipid phosphatase
LWLFFNLFETSILPEIYVVFMLGATMAVILSFLINVFSKISMHTVGMGGFVAMIMLMATHSYVSLEWVILLAIMLAGFTGTARLMLKAHEPTDVFGGYVVGIGTQFLAPAVLSFLKWYMHP